MADGYRCELCLYETDGKGAMERFQTHVRQHEWREKYSRFTTPLTEDDKVFLKVQRIAADGLA